ncbi:hypothetical protein FOCC_FOCC016736 [Frankliniella occidentalis]|nr:hypothetical protein FOCC_FOCC016736 [Frankliniella occidentalis]
MRSSLPPASGLLFGAPPLICLPKQRDGSEWLHVREARLLLAECVRLARRLRHPGRGHLAAPGLRGLHQPPAPVLAHVGRLHLHRHRGHHLRGRLLRLLRRMVPEPLHARHRE